MQKQTPVHDLDIAVSRKLRIRSVCLSWMAFIDFNCQAESSSEAGRRRVFLLCARDNFQIPDKCLIQLRILSFSKLLIRVEFGFSNSLDLREDCLKNVEVDIDAPWNEGARLEVDDWLTSSQSNEDPQRLFCMGNIVVPLQAKIGLSVIADIQTKIREA
eukprot:s1526_g5.t1